MRLVEQGKVQLDGKAWDYVAAYMGKEPFDARVKSITVRQLLTFSWGMDRALSREYNGGWVIDSNGKVLKTARELLRYRLLNVPLDFAPGARYSYNGGGYSWLQLIAELVDGRPLDRQLTEMLGPEPLSSGRFRFSTTLPSALTPAEPRFYDYPGASRSPPVPGLYPNPAPASVPLPDGSFVLEAYGGGGGLVASALTYTRFIQRLQGIRQPALLKPETWTQMRTPQTLPDGTPYVGLGVQTYPAYNTDYWVNFNGAFAGTRTAWTSTPRSAGGPRVTLVALVNGTFAGATEGNRSEDISAELMAPLLAAVDRIGYVKVAAKPEIKGESLIARGTTTEDFFSDLLFDWGQRLLPSLFPDVASSGLFDGYRFRAYPSTNTFLGTKGGHVWLYQPGVSGAINDLGAMVDYLPQAIRDTDALKASASAAPAPATR
jgi:CubicO group peptidase (beta-lactamase class C family)